MSTVADQKETTRRQWATVADGWDAWFNWYEGAFAPVIEWCCEAVDLAPGRRVLDIACGSGQPALAEAARVAPAGVTAIDLVPEMVSVARRRAAARGVRNVEFLEMDAENLQFPDATFDAATCAYALMFCPDPSRAVGEARRVLRPGCRYACVVWDQPAKSPMLTIAGQAVAQFFPSQAAGPDAPGAFRFADQAHLESALRAGGLREVRVDARTLVAEFASAAEYRQLFTDVAAGIKAKLATLSASDLDRLARIVDENAAPFIVDGRLRLPACSLCAVGTA